MSHIKGYILGDSPDAARRLAIQDAHFGDTSEALLDDLALKPDDRVVELGCGPGSFSRRILARLGPGGKLVAIDASEGLLKQAPRRARRSAFRADAGRHHNARLVARRRRRAGWPGGAASCADRGVFAWPIACPLEAGTRVGFIEPDFRTPLARLAHLQATGRPELAPLGVWAVAINNLYLANRISPDVGATLAQTLKTAGYTNVRGDWSECRSDGMMIENMLMFYDEVRDRLAMLGVMTADEIAEQQRLLRALDPGKLPAAWGIFRVACDA